MHHTARLTGNGVAMLDEILGGMDKELSAMLRTEYAKRGVQFLLNTKVIFLEGKENSVKVTFENAEGENVLEAEKVLLSVGRKPVTNGYGLENLNLKGMPLILKQY